MKKDAVVGIDIGGTFTKFGIVDRMGNILVESFISTNQTGDAGEYIGELCAAIDQTIKEVAGKVDIRGIGIGAPDASYKSGTIEYASNLKWGQGKKIPFLDMFRKHYPFPVAITNDANAAAIGEMLYGGARGVRDFILITLGTGLGSGVVVNGKLVYGHDGFAGEIGHVHVSGNGRECGCGNCGCLETYASAPGIKRTVFELLARYNTESELRRYSFDDLTSEMIHRAAVCDDFIALEAFRITGEILGTTLADSVAHTSPEKIFLFGGLAKSGDFILKPTREYFEKNLLKIYQNKIAIELSSLTDANVAVLGASALIWEEIDR